MVTAFLGKLAERTAAPAGGATAALNAAQAAALLAMTARFCDGRERAGTVAKIIAEADQLRHVCTALITADGESYGPVIAAYKLPKHTEDLRAARSAAIAGALITAAVPPTEVIAAAARLVQLAQSLQPMVNRSVAPDLAAAAEAIRAAVATSRTNLEANLSGITDSAARDHLTEVIAGVDALEERAGQIIATVRALYT